MRKQSSRKLCHSGGRSRYVQSLVAGLLLLAASLAPLAIRAQQPKESPPKLRVRGDYSYPPYEFEKDGRPTGYNVEMFRAAARAMNLEFEIELGPWNEVRSDLEQGRADVLTGMFYSEKRDRTADFSEPHIIVHHSLFVHENSDVQTLEDLGGRTLVVQEGDIMHDYALREGLGERLVAVESPVDALTLINSGNYECALMGRLQGLYLARQEGLHNVRAVGSLLMPRRYCFAVQEGDTDLLARLNEGLRVLSATGEADIIYDRWFGPSSGRPHPWQHLLPYVSWAAAGAFLALLFSILWSRSLSLRVKEATARLEEELTERRKAEMRLAEHRDRLEEKVEERTAELREAHQKMLRQERLATLGQLTATVSHELRNPLGTIRNSVYTVREQIRRSGQAAPEVALARIERSLLRCDAIIQELLEYTRSRSLSPTRVELDPWVARLVEDLQPAPGVELDLRLESGATVMIDTERFRRVIVNLITNAMQAITTAREDQLDAPPPSGGRVVLSSRITPERVEVAVSDDGPGIPQEVADDIFEPLFTTKSYGVGLGLPIVRQVMNMHGGGVEMETEPGSGTTFTVWLATNGPGQ